MSRNSFESAVLSEASAGLIAFTHRGVCPDCMDDVLVGVGASPEWQHGTWRPASVAEVARYLAKVRKEAP